MKSRKLSPAMWMAIREAHALGNGVFICNSKTDDRTRFALVKRGVLTYGNGGLFLTERGRELREQQERNP